jgi:hypothetical protein
MSIGVCYPDNYAVEETFQLFKIPWEWYVADQSYDVVIARKEDVPDWSGNLIDLTGNDYFKQISDLLNNGRPHLHEPSCDILIDALRQELKKFTLLVEIPPAPWGHPYMVALTHDVDVTSVRECRFVTIGYAAFQGISHGAVTEGLRLGLSRMGICSDPWVLFERWKSLEQQLGVRSTFFFVPKKNNPGIRAHPFRAVGYDVRDKRGILEDLSRNGWETGVHGIDNWADPAHGREERLLLDPDGKISGNRTHWLLFDDGSWRALDKAGYSYDSTFGYNDDAGFRAGTLQAYRPRGVSTLLELPLHIQDVGLFGKSCWAPSTEGWEKTPCLHLSEDDALAWCTRIFDFARTYGGVVTILWHYENIVTPRDWSGVYTKLVEQAKSDGAWVTTAREIAGWFEKRRQIDITCESCQEKLTISINENHSSEIIPPLVIRLHKPDKRKITADCEYSQGKEYIDIKLDKNKILVSFV